MAHGTFDSVETHLENVHVEEQTDNLRGGWHTEASLLKEGWTTRPSRIAVCDFQVSWNHYLYHWPFQPFSQLCWLREMIQHSKKWATARNLVEKSEVHGEDEWRVPVMREFENKKLDRQTCAQRVGFVTQDHWWFILDCKVAAFLHTPFPWIHVSLKDDTGEFMESTTNRDALMQLEWIELNPTYTTISFEPMPIKITDT